MLDPKIESLIITKTGANSIRSVELIQPLWSNYGSLSRVHLDDSNSSIILKHIKFPDEVDHPRGWSSDFGHRRKVKSYQVEMNWYQQAIHSPDFRLPKLIASGELDGAQYIILEDLMSFDFEPSTSINDKQIKLCLSWLANFHKATLGTSPTELWSIGTYWHLDSRPDEFKVMEDLALRSAATAIDKKLNSAKFQTLVHGDAKLANFLFSKTQVAAVDFQYIGGGVGIKDVAYFFSSIFDENELHSLANDYLNYYFEILNQPSVEKEWRELYPLAWTDFYRFLNGWAPGHYKVNSYMEEMKNEALKCI